MALVLPPLVLPVERLEEEKEDLEEIEEEEEEEEVVAMAVAVALNPLAQIIGTFVTLLNTAKSVKIDLD
jgi:hypothetical protein